MFRKLISKQIKIRIGIAIVAAVIGWSEPLLEKLHKRIETTNREAAAKAVAKIKVTNE